MTMKERDLKAWGAACAALADSIQALEIARAADETAAVAIATQHLRASQAFFEAVSELVYGNRSDFGTIALIMQSMTIFSDAVVGASDDDEC